MTPSHARPTVSRINTLQRVSLCIVLFIGISVTSFAISAPVASGPSSITSTSFGFSWNSVSGALSYRFDVASNSSFTTLILSDSYRPSNALTGGASGLTPGATYYYRVRAVDSNGASANSNVGTVTLAPGAPTANVASNLTSSSFTANWSAATGASSYLLDVSTSSSFASYVTGYHDVSTTSTSLNITGLISNTGYYYRLRAVNSSGTSTYSNVISTGTLLNAPVASASATPSTSTTAGFSWTSVSGALSYYFDIATNSSFTNFIVNNSYLPNNVTTINSSSLTPGTTYYFRVRANNNYGVSVNSNTYSTSTTPAAPTANSATTLTSNSFVANWTTSTGASGYLLDISTNSSFASYVTGYHDLSTSATSLTITGLTSNVGYYYRVRAVNSSGNSAYSNVISAGTLLDAPVASASSTPSTSTTAGFSWTSVSGALSYYFDIATNSSFTNFVVNNTYLPNNVTTITSSGLTPGTTYYFRVRANNSYGVSVNSNTYSTSTTPAAPTANTATSLTSSSFIASWSSVAAAANYLLDVSTNSTFTNYVTGYHDLSTTATSLTVTGLTSNTGYYYRVRATSSLGNSDYSNTISTGTLIEAPVVSGPTSITTTGFSFSWSPVSNALAYYIDVSTNSSFTNLISDNVYRPNNVTTFSVSGASSTTYWYRVRTSANYGQSANSNTGTARTLAVAPTALNATNVGTLSFTANWTSVALATSYRLDVATDPSFASIVTGYSDRTVTTTSETVTVPTANINYYYRVRTYDGENVSVNSNTSRIGLIDVNYPYPGQAIPVGNNFIIRYHPPQYVISGRAEVYQGNNPTPIITFTSVYGDGNNSISSASLPVGTDYRIRVYDATAQVTEGWSSTFSIVNNSVNYIKTTTVNKENVTTVTSVDNLPIGDSEVVYQFLDGLGRPIQAVNKQQSPSHLDIVQPLIIDKYGRTSVMYLPYSSGNDGWYKENFLDRDNGSYATAGSPQYHFYQVTPKVATDAAPYQETIFEASALNRPLKKGLAGTGFQPNGSPYASPTDQAVAYSYEFNGGNEVLNWTYTAASTYKTLGLVNAGTDASRIYYAADQLYRTRAKDENHNEIIEFTDKQGRLILRKVQGPNEYAQTYYIYDDFDHLVCVLPPEAVKAIIKSPSDYFSQTNSAKEAFLKRWAFRYNYDARSRLIKKQIPGAGAEFMVYDQRDRLIATQDSIQRASTPKYWLFTKYDLQNRIVMTGIKDTSALLSQAEMQTVVNNHFAKASARWGESTGGNIHGYTNKAYPVLTDAYKYLTVTYYDDYQFKSLWYDNSRYDYKNSELTGLPITFDTRLHDNVTGTKIKVMDGGITGGYTWLNSVNYYDDKGRIIQAIGDNYKGGQDYTSAVYDFANKILKSKTTHAERDLSWKDRVASLATGNQLGTNNATVGWNNSGAASIQQLAAGQDGWLEFVVSETNTQRMIGFNDTNPDAGFNSIDYAIYLNTTTLMVYENGAQQYSLPNGVVSGDIFRIERTGSTITYKRNGVAFRSTSGTSVALFADVAFNFNGNYVSLVGVKTSFSATTQSITQRFEYDHASRLTNTWHQLNAGLPNEQTEVLLSKNEYNELGQSVDKKLHSENSGTSFKQSVDYRYNLRGWLTSINNSSLTNDNVLNDDNGDFFGIEIGYENELGTGNAVKAQYNGNISGIKWSANLATGSIKEKAYNYQYDVMNRLSQADFKQKGTAWGSGANSAYSESGYSYDLNGNITSVLRKGKNGSTLDDLGYTYGSGVAQSNKLLTVNENTGDKFHGFKDGATLATEYTYDANGNLLTDQNKNITSPIIYNYMNLPEVIARGGNAIRYIYDATGRKICQYLTQVNEVKQTDYVGPYEYENDILRSVNHPEGRVALVSEKLIFHDGGDNSAAFTASGATLGTTTQNGADKYVTLTSVGTTLLQGAFPVGGTFNVVAGDRYRIRVKGYHVGASPAYISVKASGTNVSWPGASLPLNATSESWSEEVVTIPPAATSLQIGIQWVNVTNGEQIFINEIEIIQLKAISPEYQYVLRDHLGNVRLTFTTKLEAESSKATAETENSNVESGEFVHYDNMRRINHTVLDHTYDTSTPPNGTTYAIRLNGSANERIGLVKTLSVMPGDVIKPEVYAKYYQADGDPDANAFTALMTAIIGSTAPAGTFVDGLGYSSNSATTVPGGALVGKSSETGTVPKAYLNWLIFDRDYNLLGSSGYARISINAKEDGTNIDHERLAPVGDQIVIDEPGYVYIYLSNENESTAEVYFDDFNVEHIKSPIVSSRDYYPFGLTFNDYSRENSLHNSLQYNGKELQDELGLDWLDYGARMYMPELGRWGVPDPMGDNFMSISPYVYALNSPASLVDLEGLLPGDPKYTGSGNVVIIITDGPDDHWDPSTLDATGWDYGIFASLEEAAAWIGSTYGKDDVGISNLVVRGHGGPDPRKKMFLKFGAGKTYLVDDDLSDKKNPRTRSLMAISQRLNNNANVLFTNCGASGPPLPGWSGANNLPNALFNLLNKGDKNIKLFTNGSLSQIRWGRTGKIKVNTHANAHLKQWQPWTQTTSKGPVKMDKVPGLGSKGKFVFFPTGEGPPATARRKKKPIDADRAASERSGGG